MFELLKEGLEEALEYHRGNVKLRTKEVFIPNAPKNYKAKDIKNLRGKLKFSQSAFSAWLNVSLNTVQAWEQGTRRPSHSALRLLEVFDKGFHTVEEICKEEPKVNESKSRKRRKTVHSIVEKPQMRVAAKSKH